MSASPVNITVFKLGQQASASAFMNALSSISTQGTTAIDNLVIARQETLVEFSRRTSAINNRRVRAGRSLSAQQALKFVVSDFSDIDQANTVATVRADSASVSLKERAQPSEAMIKTTSFSANIGSIESLNSAQTLLSVTVPDGSSAPVGQFNIELLNALTLNHFIIDIVAMPSSPQFVVSVSNDGITYTQATNVAASGYRINVWLTPQELRFIRMQVTPALPDNLGGDTYTFGITDFSAEATEFHLLSDFFTKTLTFNPKSQFVSLDAPPDTNIQYYLSVYPIDTEAAPFIEMNPGDLISIGEQVTTTITTSDSSPNILGYIPIDTYLSTLIVTESGNELLLAPDLNPLDSNITRLENEYVAIIANSVGWTLQLVNGTGQYYPPRTFVVSYVYGPYSVNVQLRVRLATSDRAVSPVFQGASLDEV